jgi:DNA recombination protein RmuC
MGMLNISILDLLAIVVFFTCVGLAIAWIYVRIFVEPRISANTRRLERDIATREEQIRNVSLDRDLQSRRASEALAKLKNLHDVASLRLQHQKAEIVRLTGDKKRLSDEFKAQLDRSDLLRSKEIENLKAAVEKERNEAAEIRKEADYKLASLAEAKDKALNDAREAFERQHNDLRSKHADLLTNYATLESTMKEQRQYADEKLQLLEDARQQLTHTFEALSANALRANNDSFLQLAKAQMEKLNDAAKFDLDQRQASIREIVTPVRESLTEVDKKIGDLEKAREGAYSRLDQQLVHLTETQKDLKLETAHLVKSLRNVGIRGRWGELQLERVVEIAGMQQHCDFQSQQSVEMEDGLQRPDLTVRLPGSKNIIVDAKVPLSSYLEAIESNDDEERKKHLKDHSRQVHNHIVALSKKNYPNLHDRGLDFVVLFIPGEAFFSAAVQTDPELIEFAASQRVILATPTTLIALLKTISYGWRQEQLERNAEEISKLGRELYVRLGKMAEHLKRLGKTLKQATDAYNDSVGSMESRVLSTARKFGELGIASDSAREPIVELEQIDISPRRLQSPEMTIPLKDSLEELS